MSTEKPHIPKRSIFQLSRRNQSGQVAIFVALIFQVVFVFFALLINVGLLVHHKINLQHSTDLAAYYGAMKQAEQMNAIAHINFQIRQAWKLFTWRYRILGTFGFLQPGANPDNQNFPFERIGGPNAGRFYYWGTYGPQGQASQGDFYRNGVTGNLITTGSPVNPPPMMTCKKKFDENPGLYGVDNYPIGLQDVPFFCVAHGGFHSWPQSESYCQINCDTIVNAKVIAPIATMPTAPSIPFGGDVTGAVNAALNQINGNIGLRCSQLGPTGATVLARFVQAYQNEVIARKETLKMLASNLSQDGDTFVDIDGESVKVGAERTFKNNLTGANFSGLGNDSFTVLNGLNHQKCRFVDGKQDGQTEFLKLIYFKFLNLFIMNCNGALGPDNKNFLPESVFTPNDPYLSNAFSSLQPELKDMMKSLLDPNYNATVGFEKNPNCIEYFAVKTQSEPIIPFLPMAKVKLQAVAIAKPFGGSIGPWYGKQWDIGSDKSTYTDSQPDTKMDPTLPFRDFVGEANAPITKSVYSQPNFGLFVGDRLGVRNLDYIAAYHSMLVARDINTYGTKTYDSNKQVPDLPNEIMNPGTWPDYDNWAQVSNASIDMRGYDSLATNADNSAGVRAIELTAIAPNQFDVYHYSIDPDFFHNYYIRLYNGFDKIKAAANNGSTLTKNSLRADFGAVGIDASNSGNPGTPFEEKTFSVKDQILLKNTVLDVTPIFYNRWAPSLPPAGTPNGDTTYKGFLNYVLSLQSSVLTGWTFLRFDDYTTFPGNDVNNSTNTMAFGQCLDSWNNTQAALGDKKNAQNFSTPLKLKIDNPPTPGNCVTGGRTGYSVKIITPSQVNAAAQILNPIDQNFFNF